jgi:hypothetical protein
MCCCAHVSGPVAVGRPVSKATGSTVGGRIMAVDA